MQSSAVYYEQRDWSEKGCQIAILQYNAKVILVEMFFPLSFFLLDEFCLTL